MYTIATTTAIDIFITSPNIADVAPALLTFTNYTADTPQGEAVFVKLPQVKQKASYPKA